MSRQLFLTVMFGLFALQLVVFLRLTSSSSSQKTTFVSPSPKKYQRSDDYTIVTDHTSGCRIYDLKNQLKYQFRGFFCLFLKSGTVAMAIRDRLLMFDSDLDVLWSKPIRVHHELTTTKSGDLLVLSNEKKMFLGKPVSFDVFLKVSSKTGKILYRWSAAEHVPEILKTMKMKLTGDHEKDFASLERNNVLTPIRGSVEANDGAPGATHVFLHMNSLQEIPKTPLAHHKGFQPGNLLSDMCPKRILFTVNPNTSNIAWHYRRKRSSAGPCQHTPRLLKNGHMLVFLGHNIQETKDFKLVEYSSVWEFEPLTEKTTWEYMSTPKTTFFTKWLSGAQRLPNGNTVITHGMGPHGGRAFEVTPSGNVVWEWKNPLKNAKTGRRKAVYRVERVPRALVGPVLKHLGL